MMGRAAGFAVASAFCLALYWPGLWTWFSMDDFAWLGLRAEVHGWGDLWAVLFSPKAQGTIRPLSERLYFLTLERVFGIEALPFRVVAFATQLVNIWLAMRLVEKMTGSRLSGVLAAAVWIANSSLALAMSWSSAYNQILWPCFLLAGCHARWEWLTTGSGRGRAMEWVFFLAGFGALELQVVYPVVAGAMTLLYRRERWKDLLPLLGVAAGYAVWNRSLARPQVSTVYQLFWDESMVGTLGTYLRMATGMWRPELMRETEAWWLGAEVVAGMAVAGAAAWLLWRREPVAVFGGVWFFATLGLVLPLKNHVSDYYLTVPALGLAMVAGVAAARRPGWAVVPLAVYLCGSGYWARRTVDYNVERAEQGRLLFAGVREASQLHPGKLILLTAVNSEQFWGGMNDKPFRLLPGLQVYLAPGGDENIERHPELGDPAAFVMPGPAALRALEAGSAVVYSPAGGKLRNVTLLWREIARDRWETGTASRIELGQSLLDKQLEKGWHKPEEGFRWSEGVAVLRLGAPREAREFYLECYRGGEDGKRGRVTVVARLNGLEAGRWEVAGENMGLSAAVPLPGGLERGKEVLVELMIAPVLREDGEGGRELGLAFSRIGFR
jgi:hypothetical protein